MYNTAYAKIVSGELKEWWVVMKPPVAMTLQEFCSDEFQITTAGMLGAIDDTTWVYSEKPDAIEFRFTGRGISPQEFDSYIARMQAQGWSAPELHEEQQYKCQTC